MLIHTISLRNYTNPFCTWVWTPNLVSKSIKWGRNAYDKHCRHDCSLVDTGLIQFSNADDDTCIDVVYDDLDVFSPDNLNSVDDMNDYVEEWPNVEHQGSTMVDPGSVPLTTPTLPDQSTPHLRYLQDIIKDKHLVIYGEYSDVVITYAASLGSSASPSFAYEYGPPALTSAPAPAPPPNIPSIPIINVHLHEYYHDLNMHICASFTWDMHHDHSHIVIIRTITYGQSVFFQRPN